MRKLMLPLAAVLALAAAAVSLAACQDSAEDAGSPAPAAVTPTPSPPPGGAGGGDVPATVVAPPTPSTSAATVPDDWATFTDLGSLLIFRYPASWYPDPLIPQGGEPRVTSWDPSIWDKPYFAPNGTMVRIAYGPIDKVQAPPSEATDTTLGGEAAREFLRAYDTSVDCRGCPPKESRITREHVVVVDHDGNRFYVIGAFAGENTDEGIFLQILSSFTFID